MGWLKDRVPDTLLTIAALTSALAAFATAISVALWLLGEGGVLAVGGVVLVSVAVWEFGWDRKRRAARHAALVSAQRAPGTQALRSGVGKAHWSDRLPQPLRAISQTAPVTILAVGVLFLALLLINVFGELGIEGPDVHARLKAGTSAEVEPKFGKDYRIRVTILTIADEVEVQGASPHPSPGYKYWAAEVSIENIGTIKVPAPGWKLVDRQGNPYVPRSVADLGQNLEADSRLAPGEKVTGWVAFQIDNNAEIQWLRVTPPDPLGVYEPNHLYFDAD